MESRHRPLVVAASLALLIFVVALASRPDAGALKPDVGGQPAHVAADTFFYLFLVAATVGVLIAVWALWPRPEMDLQPIERRRLPILLAVLAAATVVALVWWRARWGPFPGLSLGQPGQAPGGTLSGTAPGRTSGQGTDWAALAIAAAVLSGVGLFLWRELRPGRRRAPTRRPAPPALAQVFDDALDDLVDEADPRQAVIMAWARMERVLAGQGAPRRAAEAPFEYAARAFSTLGLAAPGLEDFAWVYEWARFSQHEVTESMREDARSRLHAIREGIRLAA